MVRQFNKEISQIYQFFIKFYKDSYPKRWFNNLVKNLRGLGFLMPMNQTYHPPSKILLRAVLILTLIASAVVFIFSREFFYPIFLAVLLSYLLYPVAKFFEKLIRHEGISIVISIFVLLAVLVATFFLLYQQATTFFEDLPEFEEQALMNLTGLQDYISQTTPFSFESDDWLKNQINNLLEAQENFFSQIFNATTSTMVAMGVQPVYIFFMLYYRNHFRQFIFQITQPKDHPTLNKIIVEISSVTKNYVSGIFIVVLILCFINSIGLMIVGVEYALLLGLISAFFNFIPYFGTLIGGAIPLVYALVSPNPSDAIGVVILFIIVQFLENNVLTPNITGGRVAINPLFTIFAIILGGFTWGIPGMLLSVPFLGIFKVICENIEVLKPIAFVLSSRESQAKKKDPI